MNALPPYGDGRLRFLTGFPFEVFGLRSGERLPGLWDVQIADILSRTRCRLTAMKGCDS